MYFFIENLPHLNNRYQFHLMKNSRESILSSELFDTKVDCQLAVSAARRAGSEIANYPLWELVGNIRFNLFYGNDNLLIGTIRYKSIEERNQALQEVVDTIAQVQIRDQAPAMSLAA
ncbi:hypothetical protein [Larkinella sp. C7]|jgi:uncharacterized protein YegP (UPF0339 family)|uniref:hypothetical protein n=1 Tax=Larkinella sp. C7 TaxID=2576607 RepID=UPI0011115912|nr:hypothetical protein [Larkinella sp. C7]